jgi:hypothetical protein
MSRTSLGNSARAPFRETYSSSSSPDQMFAEIAEFYFTNMYDVRFRKYNTTQGRWI